MAYRESGELKDLAIDPEELLAAQRRSTKKRLLVVGIVLVVLAAAATAGVLVLQMRGAKAVKTAYGRFAQCLVGEGDESIQLRVRGLQLVAMSMPKEKRVTGEGQDAWPMRCAAPTQAFARAVKDNGGKPELVAAAEKLAKTLGTEAAINTDIGSQVEDVFTKAKAMSLDKEREKDVPAPPPSPKTMTLGTLPKDARLVSEHTTLAGLHEAPFTDTTLRFIVDEKDSPVGPVACAIAPGEKAIACKKIPEPAAKASPGLRMWGSTDEKAHVLAFAGDRGASGIYDAVTGARFVEKLEHGAYGATSFDDGSMAYLVWNDKPPSTHVVVMKDGKATDTKVVDRKDSGNPYYSSAMFWRWIAYKQLDKKKNSIRLILRELSPALGPPVDIGRIDEVGHIEGGTEEEPHLTACRNGSTMVVRAKGWDNTFLFFKREGWSAPVEAQGQHGVLTCGDNTATITRLWGGRTGAQRFHGGPDVSECTVSECKQYDVDLDKVLASNEDIMPRERKSVAAIMVGKQLAVVWSAGDRAGLRMRVGPITQLATAPETIIFDDHVRDGAVTVESTLVDFKLLPYGKHAVLLLATTSGVFAFLVDSEGKLEPLPTKLG